MKNISDIVKKILQKFQYGTQLRPSRDWGLLLAVASVLVFLSVCWNAWLFIESENGKVIGASTVPTPAAQTVIPIDDVQTVFKERATQESNYQTTNTFVDPSLKGS